MYTFAAPISAQIWDMKYRLKDASGAPLDAAVEDTWSRVAHALAAEEAEPDLWAPRFQAALHDFKVIPAGRILAGAGTDRSVTLFNCFVMGTIPDSMPGIFDALKEAALTLQQGGGIGYDFSTIRPKGAQVDGVAADAAGPIPFMDVWDSMCRTIMSAGARRGAMMATLRCDHPDIEDFVEAKRDPARLRNFNLSVLVTDPFMAAVEADSDWPLVFGGRTFRTIRARALWDRIMQATYDVAEPGVIFIDRINRLNNLNYAETISATNPCGEQPLPPYGACLLGSVNLAALVNDPFGPAAALDEGELERLTRLAVRMLDDVVDASRFPLPQQEAEARAKRRIGLGVTGLADALAMTGLRYGAEDAAEATARWLKCLARAAYLESAALAAEKGAFPLCDREALAAGDMATRLGPEVQAAIRAHGLRNALLTSIAPTGTISLLAGNVSSGIEPIFALSYRRTVIQRDGSKKTEEVVDHAVQVWRDRFGDAPLPDHVVDAQSLAPEEHVRMQAAAQAWVDSSISKTINLPEDISFAEFKQVYRMAWDQGCKGCTTYRPNAVTGSVLEAAAPPAPQAQPKPPAPAPIDGDWSEHPMSRPGELPGMTYKIKWPESEHAIYITVNDVEEGGRRRPFEVFINSKNMEHYAWTVALTRMISAVFRRGGDVSFVVEELKAVFDPRGGAWMQGRYVPSILAAIGETIETHMISIGFIDGTARGALAPGAAETAPERGADSPPRGPACPNCGRYAMRKVEGCLTCQECGHSKCG
ncbi:adenosylcobalamin-dependent ribonucleoside-diphosphate reductase [Rhodovulum sp. DZ06]|uniref:adenosylcobalamin-dependent ribonucleoside-diphosphate reductase n=1 Tax=Rhodovulum sp. DZ06 TaxID=3425126 RepID=UPI003D3500DC